ncbi:MAG TPA: serine/threonine-protein kinase [Gemmatales bacterium]|nr:serine/threonine-protein kinase [Gemmatales bacterium]
MNENATSIQGVATKVNSLIFHHGASMAETTVNWQGQSSVYGEILYRFEKAYQEGKNPDPDAFLQGEGELRWRLLVELLYSNLELKLRDGQSLRVKDYLAKYPELAQHPDDVYSLIALELKHLRQLGKQPGFQQYQAEMGTILGSRLTGLFEQNHDAQQDMNLRKVIAGRYTLVKTLGQGGMGTVYLAEQTEPVKRQVALKLISGGIDSRNYITRFEAERQALAMMDHPNIARVYDGGTTDLQQPYFVMELVQGIPITKYCDQHRLNPKARLELFVLICQAVQHAHQKGIIHRDLKPGNVLVTKVEGKPVPKVIDFGLAKATEQPLTDETIEERGAVGTPAYMSPEQADPANFDVDTRTDVYALGVILYELLTGHTPIDAKQFRRGALLEMLRMVREVDPPKPSTKLSSAEELPSIAANRAVEPKELLSWVRGDIDWIVMKALEKDRNRRYETANGFAADVQRYLCGEPVLAHPPSRWYRVKKFVKRHRGTVVAAGLVALSLLVGIIGATWGLMEAKEQEASARQAQHKEIAQRIRADDQAERAINEHKASQRLLALQANREGLRLYDAGDHFGSLLWLTQPLVVAGNLSDVAQMTRERLGAYRGFQMQHVALQQIVIHHDKVLHAAFSPDGRRIVTASWDKTACVWDTTTGKPVTTPLTHQEGVRYVTFSPDGRRVLTASDDNTACVWDAATGQLVASPLTHHSAVYQAEFSRDGQRIVTASEDGTARIWDTATGQPLTPPLTHQKKVVSAIFSPNGRFVVTASGDHTAHVWDSITGQPVTPPLTHEGYVSYAEFSPDGRRVVTASEDNTARIWDSTTGQPLTPSFVHQGNVLSAKFSPDGQRILTVSLDGAIRVWDCRSTHFVTPLLIIQSGAWHAEFSPDGRRIVTASGDKTARVWDSTTGQPLTPPLAHQYEVHHAKFSSNGRLVVTASYDNTARVWDTTSGKQVVPLLTHKAGVRCAIESNNEQRINTAFEDDTDLMWHTAAVQPLSSLLAQQRKVHSAEFSPDGRRIVTASGDKTARVWDSSTGQPVTPPLSHDNYVSYATFSPDGRRVITASGDKTARVWDSSTGQPVTPPLSHDNYVSYATFSPDGRRVVTASGDKTARVWDSSTGQPLSPPLTHSSNVFHAEFNFDGGHVVTASGDKTARVWDASTGQPLTPPLTHRYAVCHASFSPDGGRVITASLDRTARVWNVISGQPLTPSLAHQGLVLSARFSPDGQRLVTAADDKTARVWDAATGQPLTPPLEHRYEIVRARFSLDGLHVITESHDASASVWDLPVDDQPIADILHLAQVYSDHKIDDTGVLQPLDIEKELLPWYQELKAKYPEEFIPNYEDIHRWRLQQIADCCNENNLPAALFHQQWLLAESVVESTTAKRPVRKLPTNQKPTSPKK